MYVPTVFKSVILLPRTVRDVRTAMSHHMIFHAPLPPHVLYNGTHSPTPTPKKEETVYVYFFLKFISIFFQKVHVQKLF